MAWANHPRQPTIPRGRPHRFIGMGCRDSLSLRTWAFDLRGIVSILVAAAIVSSAHPTTTSAQVGGTVGVGAGSGGVRTGAGVSVGTGGLIDPIGRSVLMGAALGGIGGPIGMGAGALVGLIYGISQRERLKRQAEEVAIRQKELDKAQEQEIDALRKGRSRRLPAMGQVAVLDATGLVVMEDHLAGEKLVVANPGPNPGTMTGMIVLKDHLAPDTPQVDASGAEVLVARAKEPAIRSDVDRETERLSQELEGRTSRAAGGALGNDGGGPGSSEAEVRRKQLEAEIEAELLKQKGLLAKVRQTIEPPPAGSAGAVSRAGAAQGTPVPSPATGGIEGPVPATSGGGGTKVTTADSDGFIPIYEDGRLVRRQRDLKGSGRPDTVVYYDAGGQPVRKEESTHFDGRMDAWSYFEQGRIVRKEADTNGDGRVDFWAFYNAQGDMIRTEADTAFTGRRDLVQHYENGTMTREERLGPAGDRPRVVLVYEQGNVIRKEEDTSGAGRMDLVSYFDGRGRLVKQVRASKDQGAAAETLLYDPATGDIVRKEEDLHGNGKVDAVSYYEGGRLVRRELFDLDELPIERVAVLSEGGGPNASQTEGAAGDARDLHETPAGGRRP